MDIMRDFFLPGVIAILASVFCVWLLFPLAIRVGLVDRPCERKQHENEVPLIGGIVIFFGFNFALLHMHFSLQPYRSLIAGGALLILMGVVDDFHDLSAKLRLFGQVMVALVLASWGAVVLNQLGDLFFLGDIHTGLWALPLTIFVVVAYLNAFNMIDGQDGLAGTVALGQFIWFFVYALVEQIASVQYLVFIMVILLLVFLAFNMKMPWRRYAKIFLGDAGSTFVAFVLAWIGISLSQNNVHLVRPIAILWVMALPLFDLMQVMLYRIQTNRSVFLPGRDHLHDVLQGVGIDKTISTWIIAGLSFGLGGLGFVLNYLQIAEGINFVIFAGLFLSYLYSINLLRQRDKTKRAVHLEDKTEPSAG